MRVINRIGFFHFSRLRADSIIEVMHVIITFYLVVLINVCNFLSELIEFNI